MHRITQPLILPVKINRLDAHDRFTHLTRKDHSIADCCQNLVDHAPFGNRPFYIFAHARTDDNGSDTRLIWQPRLTRPKAQTNSMLFKAHPGTDVINVIWMIPKKELWPQYQKGKMTQNETVCNSIRDFLYNREKLEQADKDDPSDEEVSAIYVALSQDAKRNKMMANLYTKA